MLRNINCHACGRPATGFTLDDVPLCRTCGRAAEAPPPAPPAPDVRRTIYDFLHADLHMREARAILEYRRQALMELMAGERTLRTPEFLVTQDLGLLSVTCVPDSAQKER